MTIKTHGRMMTSDTIGITQLDLQDGTANQAIVTDGQGVLRFATVGAGGSVGSSVYVEDIRTGDGSTVTFTLTTAAPYEESILVFIDGVAQPTSSFTLPSTTSITFSPAPGNGAAIRICHLGIASSVADCSITGAKICMGGDTTGDILFYNGTAYQRLIIGTALQILRTNAAVNAPEWVDATTASLPAVGADGNVLTSDATNWSSQPPLGGVGGELVSHQFFSTVGSATWTRPTGVKRIRVWVVGPGGGNGSGTGGSSGGGGGGGCAMSTLDVSNLASAAVVIGTSIVVNQGGSIVPGTITNSSFNTTIIGIAGSQSISQGTTNGSGAGGGTGSGGQVNLPGDSGDGSSGHNYGRGGTAAGIIGGTIGRGADGQIGLTVSTGGGGGVLVEEYSDVSASLVGEKLVSMQSFTGGTFTWTKPANVTKIKVQLVGGGGGTIDLTGGVHTGGGGGAGYCMSIFDVRNITTAAVVVGAGSIHPATVPTNSTFTATGVTTMVAGGGAPVPTSTAGGAGGVATGGQVNINGGIGQIANSPNMGGKGAGPFGGLIGHGAKGTTGNTVSYQGNYGFCLIYEYTDASLVSGGSLVPAGVLNPYAGVTAPAGWLLCYGQTISRTTYSTLFTAISTTYGVGDGSTTFALPDMRGRTVAGQDDMGGTSANRLTTPINGDTLGAYGGTETASHTHVRGASVTSDGTAFNPDDNGNLISAATAGTIQPTIILNYIIKT